MISQSFKRLFVVCLGVIVSGCVLYELGDPGGRESDYWTKPGYTQSQIYSTIMKCRQKSTGNTSREKMEVEQMCMLRAGYKFVEWHGPNKFCVRYKENVWAWNTPACRSLRGELVITPDESAFEPPPETEESTQPRTQTVTVPITSSTDPAIKLQNQVQKDSDIQMNQLQSSPTPLPIW